MRNVTELPARMDARWFCRCFFLRPREVSTCPLWQEEVGGPGLIDEDWDSAGTSGERLHTAPEYHSASKLAPNF